MTSRQLSDFLDLVGTVRARTPEETLAAIRPHFRAMGITRIARVTGLDCVDIPVSMCVRPSARSLSVSQGKGFTAELADVSAAMESTELFHAEHAPPPDAHGTYHELSLTHDAVHPSEFVKGWFPRDSAADPPISWVRTVDLLSGRDTLIPRELVDFDETSEGKNTSRFLVSTNGLASGNTLEEATCHALYEVIERDSVSRWSRLAEDDHAAREIDPLTVDGPCAALVGRFRAANFNVRLWDATGTLGVPTYVCYIRGVAELRGLVTCRGMGAHHSRDIALSRALTEAAQARLTVICGSRDDIFPDDYAMQRITADHILDPYERGSGRHYRDCANPGLGDSFTENMQDLLSRLETAGFSRVLRLDHTRQDLQIPVVHVFVPGLDNPLH